MYTIAFCTLVAIMFTPTAVIANPVHPDEKMHAVRINEFGPPEVLRIESIQRPTPGPGELLVRVHAAAVNPIDTIVRTDGARGVSDAQLPYTPGFDLSGEVVKLGDAGADFAIGDEVFAMLDLQRGGAYAEYAIVRISEAARKPANISHEEAASLPLVALAAWQALFETADLQPGQTVLIHAGAGGVGSIAIQLAKWKGAMVIATASERNHEFLRELGADVVIDYRTQRFEDFAKDVDVVLDPIGAETQRRSLTVLREGGILVSLVGLSQAAREPVRNVRTKSILVEPNAEQLRQIAKLAQEGKLKPIVSYRFQLRDAAEAHKQSETQRTRGKIVLRIIE